jgi:alpha-L-arabinofuranosidase
MGRIRAANGHPQPFAIKHWEIGNELYGRWQFHWTTASGNLDRFKEFSRAMLPADPAIKLYACGAPAMRGTAWNDTLIAGAAPLLSSITDHPLIGGTVPPSIEPLDVYRDFMAVPEVLEGKWAALRDDMLRGGIKQPRLAVTELQLFARLNRAETNGPVRLTPANMPGQTSITEAIYNILIYHAAVRLVPFVEMITHSATVNHGGGLRKDREFVWANPCHYAQAAFAAFAESTPVAVEIETPKENAPMVLPDLRHAARQVSFGAVDALAAVAQDGALLVSIVHRGSSGPLRMVVEFPDFKTTATAEVLTLTAAAPWSGNTREQPEAITPAKSVVPIHEGKLELIVKPFSILQVRIAAR